MTMNWFLWLAVLAGVAVVTGLFFLAEPSQTPGPGAGTETAPSGDRAAPVPPVAGGPTGSGPVTGAQTEPARPPTQVAEPPPDGDGARPESMVPQSMVPQSTVPPVGAEGQPRP